MARKFTAKPTFAFGVNFRSRLECHVACTLTALNVRWKYEPRHFRINKKIHYLPDFFCSYQGEYLWLEVKPKKPTGVEVVKAKGLARITHLPVLVSTSDPFWAKTFNAVCYWQEDRRLQYSTGLLGDYLGLKHSDLELAIAEGRNLFRNLGLIPESSSA